MPLTHWEQHRLLMRVMSDAARREKRMSERQRERQRLWLSDLVQGQIESIRRKGK